MDALIQIVSSGLLLGSMYAMSAVGLSLVWGALGMLNMAHGALLTIGGYASFAAVSGLGLHPVLGLPAAMLASFAVGLLLYFAVVRWMYRLEAFETNVIIATIGLAILLENIVLKIFGAYPQSQPFKIKLEKGFRIGEVYIPWQNVVIIFIAMVMMIIIAWLLGRTRMGRAIRATAQNQDAAGLMGVHVGRVFAQVMALGGVVAGISGVMLSSMTTLAPTMGYDPMLKAFIVCVIAGLGNVAGAFYAAMILGLYEAGIQYVLGVRFALPALLVLVIVVLIWRPFGVFGRKQVTRA